MQEIAAGDERNAQRRGCDGCDDNALIRLSKDAIGSRVGNLKIGALGRHVGITSNPVKFFDGSEQPPRPP